MICSCTRFQSLADLLPTNEEKSEIRKHFHVVWKEEEEEKGGKRGKETIKEGTLHDDIYWISPLDGTLLIQNAILSVGKDLMKVERATQCADRAFFADRIQGKILIISSTNICLKPCRIPFLLTSNFSTSGRDPHDSRMRILYEGHRG